MDMSMTTYKEFIQNAYNIIRYNDKIPKKVKKILKSLQKNINKIDDETFLYLLEINSQYILSTLDSDSFNPFIDIIQTEINNIYNEVSEEDKIVEEEESYDSKSFKMMHPFRKIEMKIIDDKDLTLNNTDIIFPRELNNIKWAMRSPMELTITSDGSMWMNDELWNYLIEMKKEASPPNIFMFSDDNYDIDILELNIGYNKNNLLICFNKDPSRCMKIIFNKKFDKSGKIYATVDDDICTRFQIDTSFNVVGKYEFRPTNIYGLMCGKKVKSLNSVK